MFDEKFNNEINTIRNIIKEPNNYIDLDVDDNNKLTAIIITFGNQEFRINSESLKESIISIDYEKYQASSTKDILEKDILLHRFKTLKTDSDSDKTTLLECHDRLCEYILDNYNNLHQKQIQNLYDIIILLKLFIVIHIKQTKINENITPTPTLLNTMTNSKYILNQTYPINEIKKDIQSITEDNNVIKNKKDQMYDIDKKKVLRKTIVDIQEIELYIVYTIIFVIVILMFFFNLNKEHKDKVKMLIVLCIFMIIVNYSISRIYSIEKFSSPNIFKNDIETLLSKSSTETDDMKLFKEFLIKYLNFLKNNLVPFDNILSDIDNRMGNEKTKNMYNKENIKNKYLEQEESYHEMYRNTIYNKDLIYFILFSFIIIILLNSWYLEHYDTSMENILLFCVFIILAASYMIFITKNQYRMRDDSMKYYF